MPWTCEQTEDRLTDALEGTLTPDEKVAMDKHVAACAACAMLASSVGQTVDRLHRLEPVEPPAWLTTKILAQTTGTRRARRRPAWLDLVWQPRFALGVATVVVTFSILFHTSVGGGTASLADVNPVQMVRQINRRAHLVYARSVKFLSDLRVVYEIQSRFQPQSESAPVEKPPKSSSEKFQRLFYGRVESPNHPATRIVRHEINRTRRPA